MHDLLGCQLGADQDPSSFMTNNELLFFNLRSAEFFLTMNDLNWLDFEWSLTVLRKWPNQCVQASHGFGSAQGCDFDEDVLCVDWDFWMFGVDDWRNWQHLIVLVQNKRVNWTVSDQVKVFFELVGLKQFHHAKTIDFLLLVQGMNSKSFGSLATYSKGP